MDEWDDLLPSKYALAPYTQHLSNSHVNSLQYRQAAACAHRPLAKTWAKDDELAAGATTEIHGSPELKKVSASRVEHSVATVIEAYYAHTSFRALAAGTQRMRRAILERFRLTYGKRQIAGLHRYHLVALLGPKTPCAGRNWLKTLRGFLQFAVIAGYRQDNPTEGIKPTKTRSGEIHSWTEEEIAQFEEKYPLGTRARLAMALFLYTAQRRGDVVRMGPSDIHDGILTVAQQKSGSSLEIPVHPALTAILAATKSEHPTFLATTSGKPFSPAGFGNIFRDWCNAAGLPKHCSAHGLRKAACRRLAEAGCSEHQIASISGHRSLYEILRYTRVARQSILARAAMASVITAFPANQAGSSNDKPGDSTIVSNTE